MTEAAGPRERLAKAGEWLLLAVGLLYFAQSATLAPNHTDEGLLLQYVDAMAHGELPFRNFVDAYGLLNWVLPVVGYRAFGNQVIGVRVAVIVTKALALALSYLLVRDLTREAPADGALLPGPRPQRGRFYAVMSGLWLMVLLGAQWQSLQTPYAFLTVLPPTFGAWYFILVGPLATARRNAIAAGVLTAVAVWTKLNTGMYLLAGGLFAYFFWIAAPGGVPTPGTFADRARSRLLGARTVGAVAYVLLFFLFIRRHFDHWFFLYLLLPLLLSAWWAVRVTVKRAPPDLVAEAHVAPWLTYLVTSVSLSLLVLVGYYGNNSLVYVRELSGILSNIRYTAPFPPVGEPGHYVGLNEYYWLQLPWLLTALFVAWVALAERLGPKAHGAGWGARRAQVSALFVLVTLHCFVMYARADETHIYQALVAVVPALFVVLAQLDGFLHTATRGSRFPLRFGVATFGTIFAGTMFVVPTASAFDWQPSEWHAKSLAHLRYRQRRSPYVRDVSSDVTDRDWDQCEDEAGAYVDAVSEPGEEVLLLTANRLLHLNSTTRPIGGRYHFFFYLASVGLLDRAGFDRLVPKSVIDDILARPPRVIVSSIGFVPLAELFPELRWLRDRYYEQTHHFRHILIYELRVDGEPAQAPLR